MAGWKASGISDTLTGGSSGFSGGSIEPFYDPFDQGEANFNIMSAVNCASEEYDEKERVFAATDNDGSNGEFLTGAIRSDDSTADEENNEGIEENQVESDMTNPCFMFKKHVSQICCVCYFFFILIWGAWILVWKCCGDKSHKFIILKCFGESLTSKVTLHQINCTIFNLLSVKGGFSFQTAPFPTL